MKKQTHSTLPYRTKEKEGGGAASSLSPVKERGERALSLSLTEEKERGGEKGEGNLSLLSTSEVGQREGRGNSPSPLQPAGSLSC